MHRRLWVALVLAACTTGRPALDGGHRAEAGGPPPVRFVAFGDQGRGNDEQRRVGQGVTKVCAEKGCDFVLLLGDNLYPSGASSVTDPLWQTAFVEPYAGVDAGFYATLGNHDYGAGGAGTDFGHEQFEIDYSAVNPKWHLPAPHYAFTSGNAELFSTDTNRSKFGLDQATRASFEAWLTASKATWKIAFGHHPYKSNGRHGNAGKYDGQTTAPGNGSGVKAFIEDEGCGRADIYLCGHDHVREWLTSTCTRPGSSINTELIISGGGATMTELDPAATNADYWHADTSGFFYGLIEGRTFTGSFYDADGRLEFTRTFTK